jgi:flagellar biosynthesis/type III secretory pathway M-ring protein FliF/YscJ
MKKAWEWFKRNWKWFIAPLWILSLVLVWLFMGDRRPIFKPSGTTDEMADELAAEKEKILQEYREKMGELAERVEERLQTASKEQLEEFKEMKDKSPEEIAKWIDQF